MEDLTAGGGEAPLPAEQLIDLPPPGKLQAGFAQLDLLPSENNRLVPALLELAGQTTSASDLTVSILDKIDAFARGSASAKDSGRPAYVIKREIAKMSEYLGVFIADPTILGDALAKLDEVLASPEVAEELAEPGRPSNPDRILVIY